MWLQTIYVGRLDEEKGISSLIFALENLLKQWQDITLHIYGQGQYTNQITQLAKQYPNNIFTYGRKKKNEILTTRKRMDYFIMPSQFLETFGLTACESLLCGVPVIGNKKWWLTPFINDTLNIQDYKWNNDGEKLTHLLQHLINNNISKKNFTDFISRIQTTYSKESRYRQIQPLLPQTKTTFFISDYINYNGGGIETHIHDSIAIIKEHHHTTTLYGHQAPTGRFAKLIKLTIMALSMWNVPDSIIIHKKEKIWLLWWHSISRVIGWFPVAISSNPNQIITYHELGLFHPYPSKTYHISQIPKARSLSAFIQAGNTNNPIQKIFITGKYFLIRLIHKQLKKKVKTHIVPSERMIPMVQSRHPQAQVICIPHFVDI